MIRASISAFQEVQGDHFRVEKLSGQDPSDGVGVAVRFKGPITNEVYSSLLTQSPLTFPMPNSLASTAFRLAFRPTLRLNGVAEESIEYPISVYLQRSTFPFTQLSPIQVIKEYDDLQEIEIDSLIGIDKYGSLEDPQISLVFDIAASEADVRILNQKIREAAGAGTSADDIEWSIELSEINLARRYDAGQYPHKACLRPLSEADIEVIEDFEEKDLGSNNSYQGAARSFLLTSLSLFSITAGVISISIVLAFRHKRGLYNMLVIKESNQKLDTLLYLLACSLEQIRRPGKQAKGYNAKVADADAGSLHGSARGERVMDDRWRNGRNPAARWGLSQRSAGSQQSKQSRRR